MSAGFETGLRAAAGRLLRLAACGLIACASPVFAADVVETESQLIVFLREQAAAYEHGDGMPRDGARAAALYCEAARLGDARSQFDLGWLYANGRGVERSDATAAFFFHAAAEQGYEQAQRMLRTVGGPSNDVPECMRDKTPEAPPPQMRASAKPPGPKDPRANPWALPSTLAIDAPKPMVDMVLRLAPEYQVRPDLVLAIMKAESNFNPVALSPRNAKGLMQLIPETAERFGVRNAYDPQQNARGGMAYLRWLLAYFEGDVRLVAAAYNAGEGAVNRYKGVPPYFETRMYVIKVLSALDSWTHPFDASVTQSSPEMRRIRDLRLSR